LLGWGCGCVVLTVLVLAAAVFLGKDLITETAWYRSMKGAADQAKEDLGAALALSGELKQRFPAEDISMGTQTSFGTDAGKRLTIRILNPAFDVPEDEGGEAVARDIAAFTAARFPEIEEYDTVIVEIHRVHGGFTSQQRFPFPVGSLLPDAAGGDHPPAEESGSPHLDL